MNRLLANERSVGNNFLGQLPVFRRIDIEYPAAQNGQRPPTGFQRAAMGCRIDAPS